MWKLVLWCLLPVGFCYEKYDKTKAAQQLDDYFNTHKENISIRMAYGTPVDSVETSMTAGRFGPLLVADLTFFERLAHTARERIPERIVHAKGGGAFGYFKVTHDVTQLTKAGLFSKIGKTTSVAVRFSTGTAERGSADTVRDIRGFAIKFYTEEGIFDIMTLATPTFFIRDPAKFPQLIHAQKRNPVTNLKDWNMFWDFMSRRPETILHVMYLYTEMGIPDGFRYMNGFAGNTFKLVNKNGEIVYIKFKLESDQGLRYLDPHVALQLTATNPDYSVADLYNAIANNEYPSWTLKIQVMTPEQLKSFRWNPFDITKTWSEVEYPPLPIGKIVLNRNPTNYFTQVEQIAFNPGHLVPGIEITLDRVLQGRMFIYGDTQRYRVGPNFEELLVNAPAYVRVANYQRDSSQAYINQGGAPNYYPSSFGGPQEDPSGKTTNDTVSGTTGRFNTNDDDNFTFPSLLWQSLNQKQKDNLVKNLVRDLRNADPLIQANTVKVFKNVDEVLGYELFRALNTGHA